MYINIQVFPNKMPDVGVNVCILFTGCPSHGYSSPKCGKQRRTKNPLATDDVQYCHSPPSAHLFYAYFCPILLTHVHLLPTKWCHSRY